MGGGGGRHGQRAAHRQANQEHTPPAAPLTARHAPACAAAAAARRAAQTRAAPPRGTTARGPTGRAAPATGCGCRCRWARCGRGRASGAASAPASPRRRGPMPPAPCCARRSRTLLAPRSLRRREGRGHTGVQVVQQAAQHSKPAPRHSAAAPRLAAHPWGCHPGMSWADHRCRAGSRARAPAATRAPRRSPARPPSTSRQSTPTAAGPLRAGCSRWRTSAAALAPCRQTPTAPGRPPQPQTARLLLPLLRAAAGVARLRRRC